MRKLLTSVSQFFLHCLHLRSSSIQPKSSKRSLFSFKREKKVIVRKENGARPKRQVQLVTQVSTRYPCYRCTTTSLCILQLTVSFSLFSSQADEYTVQCHATTNVILQYNQIQFSRILIHRLALKLIARFLLKKTRYSWYQTDHLPVAWGTSPSTFHSARWFEFGLPAHKVSASCIV